MKKETKLYKYDIPSLVITLVSSDVAVCIDRKLYPGQLCIICRHENFKIENKLNFYKKVIGKIYAFGLIADVIGSVLLFYLVIKAHLGILGDELHLTVPAFTLSGLCIFVLNYL